VDPRGGGRDAGDARREGRRPRRARLLRLQLEPGAGPALSLPPRREFVGADRELRRRGGQRGRPAAALRVGERHAAVLRLANRRQPLNGSYGFFVPAPPRPSGTARLTYRTTRMVSGSAARERIRVLRSGLAVTVSLRGGVTRRYGKSFFVGWTGRQRSRPAR